MEGKEVKNDKDETTRRRESRRPRGGGDGVYILVSKQAPIPTHRSIHSTECGCSVEDEAVEGADASGGRKFSGKRLAGGLGV